MNIESFIEFEKNCSKEIRGGIVMYDVKGCYKWLSLSELFSYWQKNMNDSMIIEAEANEESENVQTILLVPEIVINEKLKFLSEGAEAAENLNNYHEQIKYQYAEIMFKNFFEKMKKVRVNLTEFNKNELQ